METAQDRFVHEWMLSRARQCGLAALLSRHYDLTGSVGDCVPVDDVLRTLDADATAVRSEAQRGALVDYITAIASTRYVAGRPVSVLTGLRRRTMPAAAYVDCSDASRLGPRG